MSNLNLLTLYCLILTLTLTCGHHPSRVRLWFWTHHHTGATLALAELVHRLSRVWSSLGLGAGFHGQHRIAGVIDACGRWDRGLRGKGVSMRRLGVPSTRLQLQWLSG